MKLKSTWIPFVLAFVAVLGLKIYQFITLGDATIRVQWSNIDMISMGIVVVAAVIIIIMSIFSKDSPKVFVVSKDFFTGTIAILTGLMVIWSSINELIIYLSYQRDIMYLSLSILGILAGLIFILLGVCSFKGKDLFQKCRLLTLLPSAWVLVRILNLFFKYNSIPTNLSHVATSFAEIFLVFFLFYQARLFAGLFTQNTFKKVFYFGFSTILFITLYATNDLLTVIDTGRKISIVNLIYIITDLVIAFYVLCFVSGLKLGKNLENISEALHESEQTEQITKDNIDEIEKNESMTQVNALIEEIKNENIELEQEKDTQESFNTIVQPNDEDNEKTNNN